MTLRTVSLWVVVAATIFIMSAAERATGDVTMISRTATKMPRGVSEEGLETTVYLKGPWMRRETRGGRGTLGDVLSARTTITDRVTGQIVTLYNDEKTYSVDTLDHVACGLENLIDLSWVGQNRGSLAASVSFPDTTMSVLGCELRPVQIDLAPQGLTLAGNTLVRIWMCTDYKSVFGDAYRNDVFCGGAGVDSASIDRLSRAWSEQFRLTDEDADLIRVHELGVPLVIESASWRGDEVLSSTIISTTRISTEELRDSLFAPPAGFELFPGATGQPTKERQNDKRENQGGGR